MSAGAEVAVAFAVTFAGIVLVRVLCALMVMIGG